MKRWTAFLMILTMCFLLCACSGNDENNNETIENEAIAEINPIIGKWKYNGQSGVCYKDFMIFHKPNNSDHIYIDEISFFNDGTFSGICRTFPGGNYNTHYSVSGTYSIVNDGSALLLNNFENGMSDTFQYAFFVVGQLTITGAGPDANTFTYTKEISEDSLKENGNEMSISKGEGMGKDNYSEAYYYDDNGELVSVESYDKQGRLFAYEEINTSVREEYRKTEASKAINTSALLSVNGVTSTDCYQVDYYDDGTEINNQRVFLAYGYNAKGNIVVAQILFNQNTPYVGWQIDYELNENGDPVRAVKTAANGEVYWETEYNNKYDGNRLISQDTTRTSYIYDNQESSKILETTIISGHTEYKY